jgi:transcriptional regulator GlxA family with amidase domain
VSAVRDAREVLFVVLPRLVLLDLAGPADAFRNAEAQCPGSYRLRFVGPQTDVRTAAGLTIGQLEPLPAQLRAAGGRPELLMCVCAGSLLGAYAGLLAGKSCTTHHDHLEELRRIEPRAQVFDNRIFVEDGALVTSAGVTAGLDLALHVIGRQLGARVAANVARDLVVYLRRAGSDPALSPWVMHRNHLHPAVHRVQDAVAREPTARWSARELAAVACTSARNLARLFAEHARCSPHDYVQLIRFALARQLVTQSRMDLERVAARSGFRSAQHLRRVWSRWEAQPPSAVRARVLPLGQ